MTQPASLRNTEADGSVLHLRSSAAHDMDAQRPFLAADIGGTHARLGLVSAQPEILYIDSPEVKGFGPMGEIKPR